MSSSEHGQGPKYQVDIEGTIHEWDRPTISTAEIVALGGWSADQGVVEVNLKTQEEITLAKLGQAASSSSSGQVVRARSLSIGCHL